MASKKSKLVEEPAEVSSSEGGDADETDYRKNIQTFEPSFEEFKDFSKYVASVEPKCKAGICIVRAPKQWRDMLGQDPYSSKKCEAFQVYSPIRQEVIGAKVNLSVFMANVLQCV